MYLSILEVHLKRRGEGKKHEEASNKLTYVKTHFLSKELKRYEVPVPIRKSNLNRFRDQSMNGQFLLHGFVLIITRIIYLSLHSVSSILFYSNMTDQQFDSGNLHRGLENCLGAF